MVGDRLAGLLAGRRLSRPGRLERRPRVAGHTRISDIDLVYSDDNDLSEETEAGHATRVRALFADLGLRIDVKNEARVHLWHAGKFGNVLAPYTSTEDAITTFPTTAMAIGVQPRPDGLHFFAPCGLSDLLGLIV